MVQAATLSGILSRHPIDALYSSSYARARDTLAPFAARAGLPVTEVVGLEERVLFPTPRADWRDHVERSFRDRDYALAGGESLNAVAGRGAAALAAIADKGHKCPAVVSHGNLIAALFHGVDPDFGFDAWADMRNPDLFRVQIPAGRITGFTRLKT